MKPLPASNTGFLGHAGQRSIKIDLKLGWKPSDFNMDGFNNEAIAIKFTYAEHKNIVQNSIRHS